MDMPLNISHTGMALVLGVFILVAMAAATAYVVYSNRTRRRRGIEPPTTRHDAAGAPAILAQQTDTSPHSGLELLSALRVLQGYLAGNERHDATLARVFAGLEREGAHTQLQALRAAVDAIEFAQAHVIVQKLIEHHSEQA